MNNNKYQPDLKENKQKRRFKASRLANPPQICCCSERGGDSLPSQRPHVGGPHVGGGEGGGRGVLSTVYDITKGFRKEKKKGTKREQQEAVKAERLPLTMSSAKLETPEPLED